MFIKSIILHNYRAIIGGITKSRSKPDSKNIFLIAGNNGFVRRLFSPLLFGAFMAS